MGYKISALESRDKKKLTSADLNFFKGAAVSILVCYTAVFSVVTQRSSWGGALRDDTKNGCVADYVHTFSGHFERP